MPIEDRQLIFTETSPAFSKLFSEITSRHYGHEYNKCVMSVKNTFQGLTVGINVYQSTDYLSYTK